MDLRPLLDEIAQYLPEGGEWCSLSKAQGLAALVVATRPRLVVEIGVWQGGSMIPILLALKACGTGSAWAIDAWDAPSSASGQDDRNAEWWSKVDHERAYRHFLDRVAKHGLDGICTVVRARSRDVNPPSPIDILHIDGNHGEEAISDAERFLPSVRAGGFVVFDDVGWTGGHVAHALDVARRLGFEDGYPLGTGCVMQRRHGGA